MQTGKSPVQIKLSISNTKLRYHKLLKALDPSKTKKFTIMIVLMIMLMTT